MDHWYTVCVALAFINLHSLLTQFPITTCHSRITIIDHVYGDMMRKTSYKHLRWALWHVYIPQHAFDILIFTLRHKYSSLFWFKESKHFYRRRSVYLQIPHFCYSTNLNQHLFSIYDLHKSVSHRVTMSANYCRIKKIIFVRRNYICHLANMTYLR